MRKLMIFLTIAACVFFSSTAIADLNDGLMAYYPFNGDASDKSGNENHGTAYGVAYISGVAGQAVIFDGIDDYIEVKSDKSLNPEDQLSIAFWVRADSSPKLWYSLIHKEGYHINNLSNPEYSVSLTTHGGLRLASAGDGYAAKQSYDTGTLPVGDWIFYVSVIDRKNHYARVYLNNILYKEVDDPYSSFNNNNEDLKIGWSQVAGGSSQPFRGSLDELRLYNRVLSKSEIGELYRSGCACKDSYMRANPIRDINDDGRIGLDDVIHALQIIAGKEHNN